MHLVLDNEVLKSVWDSTGENWFSRVDCNVHSARDLECRDGKSLLEAGFIPFLSISNEEAIRAYVKSLDNAKVSSVLDKLEGNEFVETFWKYFNAYTDISSGYDDFERKYVVSRVTQWCDENSIEYEIKE